MKIACVVHQYPPRYFTGTEQYVHALTGAFARLGHDVEVFTLDPQFGATAAFREERSEVDGTVVTTVRPCYELHRDFDRLDYRHPYLALRFGDYLDRTEPDVVHFFHLRHLGADLIDAARRRGVPTVANLMDFWFLCPAIVLLRPDGALCDGPPDGGLGCMRCVAPELADEVEGAHLLAPLRLLQRVAPGGVGFGRGAAARAATFQQRPAYLREQLLRIDRIVAPSAFLRSVFDRHGVPAERMHVVRYGVDTARLTEIPRAATDDVLRIGYMGSLTPHKGVDVLFEAFAQLRGDVRLLVWGRATDFPDYAAPLIEAAAYDDRIDMRGPFARDELATVLGEIDLLVVPSLWYENTPFVILEALAARVPVFATDLGGLSELVVDGENGELFGRGDADDLARRLQQVVDDPARLERYRSAIQPVRTLDENAEEFVDLYRGIAR